jgi:primosomal protein N'
MYILSVIPIARSLPHDTLSYFSAKDVALGSLVSVPIQKREITAIVIAKNPVKDLKSELRDSKYQIRNIGQIHGVGFFSEAFLKSIVQLSHYYLLNPGDLIHTLCPQSWLKEIENTNFNRHDYEPDINEHELLLLQRHQSERIDYYKLVVREHMAKGLSVHIICPTKAQARFLSSKIHRGITERTFHFDGSMTPKQQNDRLQECIAVDRATLVVSTPQFLDIPQKKRGLIIVDQALSSYYENQFHNSIDLRLYARWYAELAQIPIIFSDRMLPFDYWHKIGQNQARIIEPAQKNIFPDGTIQIENLNQRLEKQTDQERFEEIRDKLDDVFHPFSKKTKSRIISATRQRENIFLYVQKKSLAPTIICQDCGTMASDPETGFPFSLYIKKNSKGKKERIFVSHQSGTSIPAFDTCQNCSGHRMKSLGVGIQQIQEYLQKHIVKKSHKLDIAVVDAEHCRTKTHERELVESIENEKHATIIIGTAKAFSVLPKVHHSIIVSLDSYFSRMSHQIREKALETIIRARELATDTLIVQSRNVLEELLPILRSGTQDDHLQFEQRERKDLFLPPYSTIIAVSKETTSKRAHFYVQQFEKLFKDYERSIFTEPGKKKSHTCVFALIFLKPENWNKDTQDEYLSRTIQSLDNVKVRINPSYLNQK